MRIAKNGAVAESTASVVVDRRCIHVDRRLHGSRHLHGLRQIQRAPSYIGSGSPPFILAMTLYWYRKQHEGVFQFLIEILTKLRIKRHWSDSTLVKVKEIDALILSFYTENRMGFGIAFVLNFLVRLLGVVEIYLAAYFLGADLDWVASYLLASLTIFVNMIFVFIPGSVGVLEGAYAGVFHLIGHDPAVGTSIQIFRRIRMTLWTALGFYYIYHLDRKTRAQLKELAQKPSSLAEMEMTSST